MKLASLCSVADFDITGAESSNSASSGLVGWFIGYTV
jgi:hypothetical protein